MKNLYQSLAADLRELLPDSAKAVEITVPRRATRLLIVNHGEDAGQTLLDMTETTRQMKDISAMSDNDFDYMGIHPGDHPSVATLSFVVLSVEGVVEAVPYERIDHLAGTAELVSPIDERGNLVGHDAALQEKLVGLAAENFERYRNMGFFGPKAIKILLGELPAEPHRFHVDIVVEHRMFTEMQQHKQKQLQKRLEFLEELVRKQQS